MKCVSVAPQSPFAREPVPFMPLSRVAAFEGPTVEPTKVDDRASDGKPIS